METLLKQNEMKTIGNYEFLGKTISIYNTIENPLFLAKDVAEWIEHSQVSRMIQSVDEDEKVVNIVHTLGGNQKSWFLTEDGLYEVFMQSRKPIAKQFKKKIKEILKEIRKTGHYGELSYDNKIEIATLISKCKNAKGVEALMTLFEIKVPVIVNDNEIVGSRSKSVRAYLNDIEKDELLDIPTKRIHSDYTSFCEDNLFKPLSLNEFSKEIRRQTGAKVKRHRVDGKLTGFYEFD
ncbi:hypothetical protein A9CBEGH2_07700 [Amedibacterium intestinale]|uniref:BRO-N domain-containing protein n=1 Tax=Amedibacterium intestinale TaxID=2583452 RepID=UPI0013740588|nr:Bro-N domain-containing protein [Amedibacterium intestinale]BBK61830.1 hypothetical protein A9CBEGH2_07700 [Amedibacterium intestinale]